MKEVKYGLFSYSTENIGDEVQSIAAKRFLPRVDYYFDRDNLDLTETGEDKEIRIIMNGWFTHRPECWPPRNPAIKPLLVAMHVEQDALDGKAAKAFLSKRSREFLRKFGPVGARNLPTYDFFNKNDIDSFFSGCVTLTLVPDKHVKRCDFVLAVDVSDAVFEAVKRRTKRPIVRLDTYRSPDFSNSEKFLMAKYWLYLYQSAHAVVTTRLHTMLPCLAFQTPVFAIAGRDPKRYSGLIDLVRHSSEKDFLAKERIFDFNNPRENPKDYFKIRKDLEKRCADFTGFDSKQSYLEGKSVSEVFYDNPLFLQLVCDGVYASLERDLARGDLKFSRELCAAHEKRIHDMELEIRELIEKKEKAEAELAELTYKFTNPSIKIAAKTVGRSIKVKTKRVLSRDN